MFVSHARKKSTNRNFGVRTFSGGGRGLPPKGVGAKRFGMPLETREVNFFGGISREFAGISRGCPKSLRKKKFLEVAKRTK